MQGSAGNEPGGGGFSRARACGVRNLARAAALALISSHALGAPARFETELTATGLASARLSGPAMAESSRARELTGSVLARQPLAWNEWFFATGLAAESFSFPNARELPRKLQDCSASLALEYFQQGEPAAELTLRPGLYFDNRPRSNSWDVPLELVSGVPLTSTIQGVIGVANGRFYHHPLPIFGITTALGSRLRLQLVFPEPALIFSPRPDLSWRLRGELTGTGFRAARDTVVEYTSYQIGLELRRGTPDARQAAISAGWEATRMFDFFHEQRRWHGSGGFFVKAALHLSRR